MRQPLRWGQGFHREAGRGECVGAARDRRLARDLGDALSALLQVILEMGGAGGDGAQGGADAAVPVWNLNPQA